MDKKTKRCGRCDAEKPIEDFVYGGRIRHLCREHYAEYHKADYQKHAEQRRKWHRERNARNPEEHRQRQKDLLARYKLQVFEHYSGGTPRCACCGETHMEFLALDHIAGGGTKHRAMHTGGLGGLKTYRWAIKNGFPAIFRVLCHNCNSAYGFFGYCPHNRNGHSSHG